MLFKFMENAHLYFPLTSEQPETRLLQNHQQCSLGRPGEGRRAEHLLAIPDLLSLTCATRHSSCCITCIWATATLIDTKGGFCCMVPPVPSIPCRPDRLPSQHFSGCPQGAGAGGSPASLPDQFGVVFLVLPWKQCLWSWERECGWHSAAARCGEERGCIPPSPSSHYWRDVAFKMGGRGRTQMALNHSSEAMAGNPLSAVKLA